MYKYNYQIHPRGLKGNLGVGVPEADSSITTDIARWMGTKADDSEIPKLNVFSTVLLYNGDREWDSDESTIEGTHRVLQFWTYVASPKSCSTEPLPFLRNLIRHCDGDILC